MSKSEIVEYVKKSFSLKNQGFYKPAIEMLYKALSLDHDNLEILAQLAELYAMMQNYERAIYYTEKVFEVCPTHLECLMLLEDIYLKQNNLVKACEMSDKIYQIKPTSDNLAKRINLFSKVGNLEKIIEIASSPEDFDSNVLYELACGLKSDIQKSKFLLEKALMKNPENYSAKFLLGKIYYEENDFDKAKNIIFSIKDNIKTPEFYNYLGLFELSSQNFLNAIDYFKFSAQEEPLNAKYQYNLASAYFLNGWIEEAQKYFQKAISIEPQCLNYRFSLAYLFFQNGELDKAEIELNEIKNINSNHLYANILFELIRGKKGDLLNAKERLESIINSDKNSGDFALWAISRIYRELNLSDKAERAIEKAIELKPQSVDYLNELMEIQITQKKWDGAKETIQKIMNINKNYGNSYIAMAKISLEKGDFEAVYDAAQDLIELDSNCAEGYYYNSLALFNQGDVNFAIESLKKSISLDISNAALYAKMSEFYQEIGDFKTAFEWMKEASLIDEMNYKYKWLTAKLALTLNDSQSAIKYYSKAYRLAIFDKDLVNDYADFLKSIGQEKQAKKILSK